MEKLIHKRLSWYLEINNLLSPLQSGYRKNRSTLDHLVRLETFIRQAFVNEEHLSAIFFDLEKAFDTTWKHGITRIERSVERIPRPPPLFYLQTKSSFFKLETKASI